VKDPNVSLASFLAQTSTQQFGDFVVSGRVDATWWSQMQKYQDYFNYWSGRIFNRRASDEHDAPPLYPLRVNIARLMCLTQAGTLFGQWEDEIIGFMCKPLRDKGEAARRRAENAEMIVRDTWDYSRLQTKLYETGLSTQVYGGCYLRVAFDMNAPHWVRVDKLMPYQVFPRYHPIDTDRLLEAYIVVPGTKEEIELAYGVKVETSSDVLYVEHWTEKEYAVYVAGQRLTNYGGANPWGRVPIEYIPRIRLEDFYGLSLIEDLRGMQDELNLRLADMGDRVANNAHPIRWVVNYRGDPEKDFKMGADALWNLGSAVPGADKPEVGVLEPKSEPSSSFEFIKYVNDLARSAAFTSPVAFGEDEGSQRSGATLELRLWPMLQNCKVTRGYMVVGLSKVHDMILKRAAKDRGGVYEGVVGHRVVPSFAPLVPRDLRLFIEEFNARAAQDMISPEEALAGFGVRHGTMEEEIERIKQWLREKRPGGDSGRLARREHSGALAEKADSAGRESDDSE
jgi:hypothetical protein